MDGERPVKAPTPSGHGGTDPSANKTTTKQCSPDPPPGFDDPYADPHLVNIHFGYTRPFNGNIKVLEAPKQRPSVEQRMQVARRLGLQIGPPGFTAGGGERTSGLGIGYEVPDSMSGVGRGKPDHLKRRLTAFQMQRGQEAGFSPKATTANLESYFVKIDEMGPKGVEQLAREVEVRERERGRGRSRSGVGE